ncbi:MAG: phytase, partial [Microcoleaceae cyanobacterium]
LAMENEVGILKFQAEPEAGDDFEVIYSVDEDILVPDLEGLTLYYGDNGSGYLIASSQGDSSYALFDRAGSNEYLDSFVIAGNGDIDQINETDGFDITNVPLGSAYPNGLFVVHDGANDPQSVIEDDEQLENNSTNFKFVPWENVANAFPNPLNIDTTSYDPRNPAQGLIAGTADAEVLTGTDGDDLFNAANGKDTVAGGLGNDLIYGEAGNDLLRGDLNERVSGVEGGNDTIFGGLGNDRISGKAGNDELYGNEGNDRIWGDQGDDLIRGGLGNDKLYGDSGYSTGGVDTFILAESEGMDTIYDFEIGIDLIGLAGGLTFGDLALDQQGQNALINFGETTLAVLQQVNVNSLSESDFVTI